MNKYVCYWGEGYGSAEPEIVSLDFFTASRGYSDDEQESVESLQVGQTVNFSDLSGTHFVTRVG